MSIVPRDRYLLMCWNLLLYLLDRKISCITFIERGFYGKELKKTIRQVTKTDRNEFLRDRTAENKDTQTILVSVHGIPNLGLSHLF